MAPTHTYTTKSNILIAPRGGCRCRPVCMVTVPHSDDGHDKASAFAVVFAFRTMANQAHRSKPAHRRVSGRGCLRYVCVALDPVGVCVHELLKKFACALIRECTRLVKSVFDAADICLRHLQARHV